MQESFVFYASFFEAGQYLTKRDRLRLYDAIGEYALNGRTPELSGAPMAVFCVIKPLIDANRTRRENGKTGGRPQKENKNHRFSDVEETGNHRFDDVEETGNHRFDENEKCREEKKPNENVNENENVNKNENVNVNVTAAETGTAKKAEPSLTDKKPKFPVVTFGYDEDGKFHGIDENLKNYWRNQFPGLDIEQELRSAESWLDSNRSRRKQNIKSFLTNWMIRSQEKQNSTTSGSYDKLDGNIMDEVSEEERRIFNGF